MIIYSLVCLKFVKFIEQLLTCSGTTVWFLLLITVIKFTLAIWVEHVWGTTKLADLKERLQTISWKQNANKSIDQLKTLTCEFEVILKYSKFAFRQLPCQSTPFFLYLIKTLKLFLITKFQIIRIRDGQLRNG